MEFVAAESATDGGDQRRTEVSSMFSYPAKRLAVLDRPSKATMITIIWCGTFSAALLAIGLLRRWWLMHRARTRASTRIQAAFRSWLACEPYRIVSSFSSAGMLQLPFSFAGGRGFRSALLSLMGRRH